MHNNLNKLINEIDNVYKKIGTSFNSDNRIALIELTRCIDHAYVYTTYLQNQESQEGFKARKTFQFLATGFVACMKLFYNNDTAKLGCPLYPSSKEMINWANSSLIKTGHVGYTLRFIELAYQGLFKVKKNETNYIFKNLSTTPGLEQMEAQDFYWWQTQNYFDDKEVSRLMQLKLKVESDLRKETEIWKSHFIKYGSTDDLDEYYELLGKLHSRTLAGYDSFPEETNFNGLSYGEIKMIIETLVGYALKHKDHCLTLLEKSNYNINPWNIYTLPELLIDLAESVVIHTGIHKEKILEILNIITLSEKNIDRLAKIQGGPPPLLIKISNDHVLKSLTGCLLNPFSFLVNTLKNNYERDYFIAVNYREDIFKKDLYNLFESISIHKCATNINLKNKGNYITDVDALLYDEINKCLLVIQLKWLDNFGDSMKMRVSMSKNFYNSSIKWVENVVDWIERNGAQELVKRITSVKPQSFDIKEVKLLILGRNFSHFSDFKQEKRASWISWYGLQRVLHEKPEFKINLHTLMNYLEENSLAKRQLPLHGVEKLQVGKYSVSIKI